MKMLHKLLLKLGYRPTHWTDEMPFLLIRQLKSNKKRKIVSANYFISENKTPYKVTLSVKKMKK